MRRSRQLICLTVLASASAVADVAVTVEVQGVCNTDGQMYLSVFDSKKAWLKKPSHTLSVDVAENTVDCALEMKMSLPEGAYAFQVFQDLDSNGKMKTNFIGIPKEPIGVSRDAKGKFGPPKFKNAVVSVDQPEMTIVINLTKI